MPKSRPFFSPILFFSLILLTFSLLSSPVSSSSSLLRLPTDDDADTSSSSTSSDQAPSCPVSCFRPNPVCGMDGVTYWCGPADAACSGVHVAKVGFCEVGNGGGEGLLSGQAFLLVHIVWLFVLGFFLVFGLF